MHRPSDGTLPRFSEQQPQPILSHIYQLSRAPAGELMYICRSRTRRTSPTGGGEHGGKYGEDRQFIHSLYLSLIPIKIRNREKRKICLAQVFSHLVSLNQLLAHVELLTVVFCWNGQLTGFYCWLGHAVGLITFCDVSTSLFTGPADDAWN